MKGFIKVTAILIIMILIVFAAGCKKAILPTVKTTPFSDLTMTQVVVGGIVTSDGGSKITEQGICWGRDLNPDVNSNVSTAELGDGSFTCKITGLDPSTTYYARAYAINSQGVGYGNQISFITLPDNGGDPTAIPVVETSPVREITQTSAIGGGVVTATGGSLILERGVCWNTQSNPIVSGNHVMAGTGVGSFSCDITDLEPNTTYYVRAYAINSLGIGYGNEVIFTTLSSNGGGGNSLEGVIGGAFSVSASQKVYFSQGNLQYQPSTGVWRFADKQYSLIHVSEDMTEENGTWPYCDVTNEYTPSFPGWIDLFGWGTSGWNNGNIYYHPWDIQQTENMNNANGYGPTNGTSYEFDLTGIYANSDWGVHNPISNGGNQAGIWRTLTRDEWNWILSFRNASVVNGVPNARFAKAKVNEVYGLILFPDSYSHPLGVSLPVGINFTEETNGWNNNSYNVEEWLKMENAGAVFLPASGYRRYGASTSVMNGVYSINIASIYWTSSSMTVSSDNSIRAIMVECDEDYMGFVGLGRACGCSVRLVQDAQP